jgi:prepilin signal peptidase PulO-like enzyme (type II secretory pathway)
MTGIIVIVIKIACAAVLGFLAGHAVVYVFNRIPAHWLCDYDEEPDELLKDTTVQRIKGYPWKLVFSAFFVVGAINLVLYDWQFCLAALVFCWALVIIAASDSKYGIIPDQFVILTAVSAIGFLPFYGDAKDLIFGCIAGGGLMLVSSVAGKLIFRKETLGFGDVKLFAAVGLVLGLKGTLAVLVMSSLSCAAAVVFKIIRHRIRRDDMVPLGPYICGAAIFYVAIVCPLL